MEPSNTLIALLLELPEHVRVELSIAYGDALLSSTGQLPFPFSRMRTPQQRIDHYRSVLTALTASVYHDV